MPDGTQVAQTRSPFQPDSRQTAAVVSFPEPVGRSSDLTAGLAVPRQSGISPRSPHPLTPGTPDPLRSPVAGRRSQKRTSPRFRCPHCGGRDSLGVETRPAKTCQQQLHRCADCLQAIPRHLAERWLGLSFEEARRQWRGFRDLAAGKKIKDHRAPDKPFFSDSFALLRLLRREVERQKSS